jgi:hypothetical protein
VVALTLLHLLVADPVLIEFRIHAP